MQKLYNNKKKHYPQLDSLRAFAVAGVAWHHWMPHHTYGLPFGSGVKLFFVLSGFLITGILLDAKKKSADGLGNPKTILKNFYIRRFLRIFPLYYAVLIAATILCVSNLRETYHWYFLFTTNFYLLFNNEFVRYINHFWSLAIEEQFYLFWPLLVFFIPTRRLPLFLVLMILLAPMYRLIGDVAFAEVKLWDMATIAHFDSLSIGALLAYYRRFPLPSHLMNYRFGCIPILTVSILAGFLTKKVSLINSWLGFSSSTFLCIAFGVLIHACVSGIQGPIGKVLEFRVFRYLGTISYGLYVLHLLASIPAHATLKLLPVFHNVPGITLILMSFWTVFGAALSWKFFEAPLNQYKRYFPYNPKGHNKAPTSFPD